MHNQTEKTLRKRIKLLPVIFALSLILTTLFAQSSAWAALPAAGDVLAEARISQSSDVVRIVLDLQSLPQYTETITKDQLKIVVNLPGVQNKSNKSKLSLNDPVVESITFSDDKNTLKAVISLKNNLYIYKVFTLKDPNRLVIDIIKNYEEKKVEQVTPAIKYTSWQRVSANGKMWAHILEIHPNSGYILKPVLGKGAIRGLESLSDMSGRTKALAMVNASYYNADGSIIGLLKINKDIVSTFSIPRAALGIIMNGYNSKVIIGQPEYNGKVELSNGKTLSIDAVNKERGANELILYNAWYEASTKTNSYGVERTVKDGTVIAEGDNNSQIPENAVVLSAHGTAAQVLGQLKRGDKVKITETLGADWDKARYVVGAGPMLLQNKNIYLTTKIEGFGDDVGGGKAPRTALGVTDTGNVLLVVIDGRQMNSAGMTLLELAQFMQELGACDAMNLDGGGSSEMIIKDNLVNKPSDGRERRISSALALLSDRD